MDTASTPPEPRPTETARPSEATRPSQPTVATPHVTWSGPPKIVVQMAQSRFGRLFGMLGWIGLAFCIPTIFSLQAKKDEYFGKNSKIGERFHSGSKSADDKIAIIKISGAIMSGEGYVKKQIEQVADDEDVKGIVLRVNSPGGTVSGSDYMYHHLVEMIEEREIPLVVSMGPMAASGGYYVSMAVGDQEESIYAEPTTTTGSIGVIVPHYDVSGLMKKYDVKSDSIVSHPRKQMLSMAREMTPEDREVLQRYVDQAFQRFRSIVLAGRPEFRENPEKLDALATGEIFSAEQAEIEGLVDRLGFVDDAIERCAELANLDMEDVRVVSYKRPVSLLESIGVSASVELDPQMSLLRMTVPRAYYMLTTLPGLTSM